MPLIVRSQPHPTVHLLTFSAPPDNRLTPELLSELGAHLDDIEADWRKDGGGEMDPAKRNAFEHKGAGAVVLTSACKGFFSNGLDYKNSVKNPRFFPDIFDPVMYRLLTFPLVTVAAINGHAFAGGFILALACDFRLMTSGRGLMCMNELTFSSPLPNSFGPILSQRIPHPQQLRDTLLARRWTQKEGLSMGILDEIIDDSNDTPNEKGLGKLVKRAIEVGVREGVKVGPGSWGAMKDQTYHAYIDASQSDRPIMFPRLEAEAFWKRYKGDKGRESKL